MNKSPAETTPYVADRVLELKLSALQVDAETFSPRRATLNEAHIGNLMKVLEGGRKLAPIVAWRPEAGGLWLVDGHHRHEAYRRSRWGNRTVPVLVVHGTKGRALLLAVSDNAKARLPLTPSERSDWAWRLIREEQGITQANIAAATGVSLRTVATMAENLRKARGRNLNLTGNWLTDQHNINGTNARAWSAEDVAAWQEQRRERLEKEIRSLSAVAARHPEVAAEALINVLGRNLSSVLRQMREAAIPDDEDDWLSDF